MNAQDERLIAEYFDVPALRSALKADSAVALHDAYAVADTILRRRGEETVVLPRATLRAAYDSVSHAHAPGESLYLFLRILELLDGPSDRSSFVREFAATRAGRGVPE